MRLFIGKASCIDCHNGPALSDNQFHNIGVGSVLAALLFASIANGQWQVQKVRASDGQREDWFGFCVALDGDWAAIGAPNEDSLASDSGAVAAIASDASRSRI